MGHFGALWWANMIEKLNEVEEKILEALFREKRLWYREFLVMGISDKPLRRSLERLQERGYIVKDMPTGWKRGMKIHYYLTSVGEQLATRLIVGNEGRDIFLQVLDKMVSITELYDDEGDKVLEVALEMVNFLWDKKKSMQVRDALIKLIDGFKSSSNIT